MATVAPALYSSRPTRLDRIVRLTGTALISWSERRVARRVVSHEERSRQLAVQRERSAFDQLVLKQWYRGER
ncbi:MULTISPECIES: hypothetical protein [unclassified Diaminobutyricimonas]|uniref:hypothetical protein n=1 Tax=unclassified Diaminobutyricimonas TaxID=2643261 RepID=UPI0012F48AB9|nr:MULTISPECIES: hypothetical protein [unclassified Diaminobutyricimonas]